MTQLTVNLVVDDQYKAPEGVIETNEDYINFVINMASQSYKIQYGAKDIVDGIEAARQEYNKNLLDVAN